MSELVFKSIKNNPAFDGLASLVPNIVYSTARGLEIKMHILTPQSVRKPDADDRHPCIVFVQGSAWTFPDVTYEIPQMSEFARNGYVVAMVTHRSALDGHKAPAFLEDVKTAIRFLRANADTYKIDPERIGIWGTSSGGNTALLVGLTADDPVYKTDEYADFSDGVKTVVECFGPADLRAMWTNIQAQCAENEHNRALFTGLLGDTEDEQMRCISLMNPVEKVKDGVSYPPFLLIHGDKDELVPYEQSVQMADTLCAHDVHTEMIRVEGAEHEGTFWSRELLSMIADYITRTL